MNLQSNTFQITQPKSCVTAILNNYLSLAVEHNCEAVVDSVNGLYARLSHSIWMNYLTIEFLPLEKWITDDWEENEIVSLEVRMNDPKDDRELDDLLRESEDILHGHLTGKGYWGYVA